MLKVNKVYLGDCLNVMKRIESKSIDMILCDLPYGTTACKWDVMIPFEPLWAQYRRIIKDRSAIVLNAAQPFTSMLIMSNPKWFKYEWIWEKNKVTGFLNAKKQPLRNHESVLIFYKKQCIYDPQKTSGHKPVNAYTKHTSDGATVGATKIGIKGGGSTKRYPKTVQRFSVVNQDGTNDGGNFHPNQKPLSLVEYFIKTYTNEGALILDNCAGSGTTGVACKKLKRRYILIEKKPEYVDIARKRLKKC